MGDALLRGNVRLMHEGIGDTSSENHVGVEMAKRWGDVAVPASPKPQYEGHKAVRFPTYFVPKAIYTDKIGFWFLVSSCRRFPMARAATISL